MTATRRRPLKRDALDIEATARRLLDLAPELELGWSCLRTDMADAGWTATTPAGDRKQNTPQTSIRCRECDEVMQGSAARDHHENVVNHHLFEYVPTPATGGSTLTHSDPTAVLGLQLDRLTDELLEIQDAWHNVRKFLAIIETRTRRHIPDAAPGVPACAVETCDGIVETATGGYRGMDMIAGHWVAKPGCRPVCAMHRTVGRRLAS
jgi:hypothetical protein